MGQPKYIGLHISYYLDIWYSGYFIGGFLGVLYYSVVRNAGIAYNYSHRMQEGS